MTIWDKVEIPAGSPSRHVDFGSMPEFTVVERVRDAAADDDRNFEATDMRARWLRSHRQSGFEHVWRGAADELISPTWLTLGSAVVDATTGRIAATGFPTHEVWNLPPAHDLGAIDGRNMGVFVEAGHPGGLFMPSRMLYIGSTRTGILLPLDASRNSSAVDILRSTGEIAVLEFLGSTSAAVCLIDPSGERRLVTVVDGLGGDEPLRFSPDGSWLLIPASSNTTLIEVATGRWIVLEVPNAGWWPTSDSTLFSLNHVDGTVLPRLYSLETAAWVRNFPPVELDVPLMSSYPYIWFPDVSSDGREFLGGSPAGASSEYQKKNGVGSHTVRVTIETGRGVLVHSAFLSEGETLERDTRDVRWTERAPARSVRLAPELEMQLAPPVLEHIYLAPGRWADENERVLVPTLNEVIERFQNGYLVSSIMPEVIATIAAIADTPTWQHHREWLVGISTAAENMLLHGQIHADDRSAWRNFCAAVTAADSNRPETIDVLASAWR